MATSMTRFQHHFSQLNTIYRRHTVAFEMLPASIELVRCDAYEPGIESPIVEPSRAHLNVRTGASVVHSIYMHSRCNSWQRESSPM